MQGGLGDIGGRRLELAAQLAAVFVRPLDVFDSHAGRLEPLTATETRAIAAHPAFRAPLNRAMASALQLANTTLDEQQLARLNTDGRLRCAVLLVSQPQQALRQAATVVAAAVLHRRVLKIAFKAEIGRIREVLGAEGFEIATREAPLLHAALGELDAAVDPAVFDAAVSAAEGQRHCLEFGLDILCRFVDGAVPALSDLMRFRCRSDLERQARGTVGKPLHAAHCDHIVKLIRRRMPSWSATIG